MSMHIDTLVAIAEAFENGVRDMSSGIELILNDLADELAEKHRIGAPRLDQPTVAAYADLSADGGVGVRVCFGELEYIKTVPMDARGIGFDSAFTNAELSENIRALIPVMSDRDYVVELLHRARSRLQRAEKGVAA